MRPGPPRMLEAMVGLLIPPACREHVLGDLHERYQSPRQYVADAMFTVPSVVRSRIRRTTDPQVLAMEAFAVYLSFLCAGWWAGASFPSGQRELSRLAIPTLAALVALMLRNAYEDPGKRSRWRPFLDAAAGAGGALFSQAALWNVAQELVLPSQILIFGGGVSVLLVATLRAMVAAQGSGAPVSGQGGHAAIPPKDFQQKSEVFLRSVRRGNMRLLLAALLVAVVLLGMMGKSEDLHSSSARIAGTVIVVLTLYVIFQVHRKGAVGAMPPETGTSAARDVYRAQLQRRREALHSVWWWYIGPMLAILMAFALQFPLAHPDEPGLWLNITPFTLLAVVWSVGAIWQFRREEQKLQKEIDTFDKR